MAYITANEVASVRAGLKARFPQFKFGVRKGAGSLSIDVTIKQGPIDFIENYNRVVAAQPGGFRNGSPAERSLQINQYWFQEHFDGDAKDMLAGVMEVIKSSPDRKWYDNSDAMTDYFDTAFYIHLQVGSWDQPYVLVK